MQPSLAGGAVQNASNVKVQVKKVPGTASPEDSAVVHGLVCRKNVAHKRMRTHIKQPRIIMLGNTLEYHRTKHKLSSFDTLLDQVCHRQILLRLLTVLWC